MKLSSKAIFAVLPALAAVLAGCESLGLSDSSSSQGPSQSQLVQDSAGQQSAAKTMRPAQFSDAESAALRKVAEQYVHELLTAIKERNYKLFIRNLTDEMKVDINEQAFKVMVDEFDKKKGPYAGRQFLGDLSQGYFKVFLWKAQFEPPKELVESFKKQGKDPSEMLRSDTLIRLEISKVDGAYKVVGIYFQ